MQMQMQIGSFWELRMLREKRNQKWLIDKRLLSTTIIIIIIICCCDEQNCFSAF